MSDHDSPRIYSAVFDLLAVDPTEDHKELARKIWATMLDYDFTQCDLACGEALCALGLAERVEDEYGPLIEYLVDEYGERRGA